MNADQAVYHHGYSQEHDPNIAHHQEGEDENDHQEKKSYLEKVKQKAKKIKDTIKKHGYGHNHDQDHDHDHDRGHQYPEGGIPDDHDLDEEDDDEKDIVDPEVHGAPMNESAAVRSALPSQPEDLSRPGIANERTKTMQPDTEAPIDSPTTFYSGSETEKTKYNNDPGKTSVTGTEATLVTEQPNVYFGRQTAVFDEPLASQNTPVPISRQSRDDDPTKTFVHGEKEYPGQPEINLQRPKGLEEDPATPKDTPDACTATNYQTKVTDPTGKGGEVTGMTPILHSFEKMNFDDEQDTGREQNFPPGSHHRPSEFLFPTGSHDQSYPEPTAPSLTQTSAEKSPSVSETMDTLKPREQMHNIESDKPSNQSSYEVTEITPTHHSFDKMNFEDEQDTGREQNFPPGSYHTQSDLPFPPGSHDQFSPEPAAPTSLAKSPEKSPSVSETMSTSKPQEHSHNVESDKPSNQSSYTEKISSATSAIADKAASAKNIVASKLGYGEKDQTPANESHEGQDDANKKSSSADYGKKTAVTVTEKLTPVYEKVAGLGSTVMSKLHGPGSGTTTEVGSTEVQDKDKGVSMRNYISEKLRPGEEDRALSQVITDALRTQKGEAEKETRARGKVTESDEVARRLGTAGSENSPSSGTVDKVKGTVSSWFGKADESQQAQRSPQGNEDFSSSTYERRLQESGN